MPGQPESSPTGPPPDSAGAKTDVAELFRDHNRVLVRLLTRRLGSVQEARDVAQEAYARLLELERTNTVGHLRAYLFRIAINLAVDRIRSRVVARRVDEAHLPESLDGNSVEREAIAAQEAARFWQFLAELPRDYRRAIVLHRIQDLSCLQIASQLGKTDRTVRRYVAQALAYCRLRLLGLAPDQAWTRSGLE